MTPQPDPREIVDKLSEPFDLTEVKFKPSVVKNNRALAMAYIDARVVQDRLDDVLGVAGWQDEYTTLDGGSVVCRLRLKLGDDWITKMDVGSPSEQPDGGDRMKAAFSDALKRAAVKFGIGRYLYRLPAQWCDYDPMKKQFTRPPTLPAFAQPQKTAPAKAPYQDEPAPEKPAVKDTKPDPAAVREAARKILETAAGQSMFNLSKAWETLSPHMKEVAADIKDELKARLQQGVPA